MQDIQNIIVEQDPKPKSTIIKIENIPEELKSRKAWCIWKYELVKNQEGVFAWTKVPRLPYSQKWAKSNDRDTWSNFDDVIDFYQSGQGKKFDGIGTFLDVDIVGIDVDVMEPEITQEVLSLNSYVEISPSGKGIRSFIFGQLPEAPEGMEIYKKKKPFEMYSDVRFLTVTGNQISPTNTIVANQDGINAFHAEHLGLKAAQPAKTATAYATTDTTFFGNEAAIVHACMSAKNGSKFQALHSGDWQSEGFTSQSEADQAFCNMICFFCGEYLETKDINSAYSVINSIFKGSGLYRDKWERHDYQSSTINNAINSHIDGKYCSLKLNRDDEKIAEIVSSIDGKYKPYNFDNNLEKFEAREAAKSNYKFAPLNSKTFFNTQYKFEWLIKGVMVSDQACIVGGPKKSLKTNILIDMVISIATGTKFLGKFQATQKKICLVSGESGEKTIQETAVRICKEKGINPEDCDVMWDFRLPRLSIEQELNELSEGLKRNGIQVVVIDPLYLCLLAGSENKNASNLYDMGTLLMTVRDACERVGCQLILCHHAKKSTINMERFQPLDLEDLAFAGVGEFARQWVFLSRRSKYNYDGKHELWFVAGGSAGHAALYALNVFEGTLKEDFSGRIWDLELLTMEQMKAEKIASKENDTQTDVQSILGIIERFPDITEKAIKAQSDMDCVIRGRKRKIGLATIRTIIEDLVNAGEIKKSTGKTFGGNGGTVFVTQFNLCSLPEK